MSENSITFEKNKPKVILNDLVRVFYIYIYIYIYISHFYKFFNKQLNFKSSKDLNTLGSLQSLIIFKNNLKFK